MRRQTFVGLIGLLLLFPATVFAYDFAANPYDSKGRNSIWESRSARINLGLDEPGLNGVTPPSGGSWNALAEQTLSEWEGIVGSQFTFVDDPVPRDPCNSTDDNENRIGWADLSAGKVVCGYLMPPGILGLVFRDADPTTGFFRSADILLNAAVSWTGSEQTQLTAPFMLQTVLAHEVGHLLGLDHEDDVIAVMNSGYHPTPTLHADDRAGMRALYPGVESALDFTATYWNRVARYPQMAPGLVIPPSVMSPGSGFLNEWTIEAIGNQAGLVSLPYTLVLSSDQNISPEDRVLLSGQIGGTQGGGGSFSLLIGVVLPNTLTDGTYFLGLRLDPAGTLSETNRENNNILLPFSFQVVSGNSPDLIAVSGFSPFNSLPSLAPGESYTSGDTTYNIGTSSAGSSVTQHQLHNFFYLSRRFSVPGHLEIPFRVVGERAVPPLSAGGGVIGTVNAQVPSDIIGGTYMHVTCADINNAVSGESSEVNNCSASLVVNSSGIYGVTKIGPNLIASGIMANTSSVPLGGVLTLTSTITNIGNATAGSNTVGFGLLPLGLHPSNPEHGVHLRGSFQMGNLVAGGSVVTSASLTLPSAMAPGFYLPVACPDDAFVPGPTGFLIEEVFESIEFNCNVGAPIEVTAPELSISTITSPAATDPSTRVSQQEILNIIDTVINAGSADAGPFSVHYFLSLDDKISRADILLEGRRQVVGLGVGAADQPPSPTEVAIPDTIAPGVYFLGACVDGENDIFEGHEEDNCTVAPGKIKVIVPTLIIESGNDQEAGVGMPYVNPLVVKVTDGFETNPEFLPDMDIVWAVFSGEASFTSQDVKTGPEGKAEAQVQAGPNPEINLYEVVCTSCSSGIIDDPVLGARYRNYVFFEGAAMQIEITLTGGNQVDAEGNLSVLPRGLPGVPMEKHQSNVTVTVLPAEVGTNRDVSVSVVLAEGGGHAHDLDQSASDADPRPTGGHVWKPEIGPEPPPPAPGTCLGIAPGGITLGATEGDADAEFIYTSCEVSGTETIEAVITLKPPIDKEGNPHVLKGTKTIEVKVPDLGPLTVQPGDAFGLKGETIQHPVGTNHYATEESRNKMRRIANGYASHPKINGRRLGINDMSLEKGGLFDVDGDWRPTLADCMAIPRVKGHCTHRDGKDADIDRAHFDESPCRSNTENVPGTTCVKQKVLRAIILKKTLGASTLLLEPKSQCSDDVANRLVPSEPGKWQICKMHIDLE